MFSSENRNELLLSAVFMLIITSVAVFFEFIDLQIGLLKYNIIIVITFKIYTLFFKPFI